MQMKAIEKGLPRSLGSGRESGLGLLDVVLAIAVFAFGMLALVQFQGNLARSSADANMRTVAAGIAEELAETVRSYQQVEAIPDNGQWEYMELDGDALNLDITRGGITYTRTVTISHFWWDAANNTFVETETATPPEELDFLVYPDFKLLRFDVSWDTSQEFYVDDDTTADVSTGSVTVYEVITSSPPALGAVVAAGQDEEPGILVNYLPGDNPETVALALPGANGETPTKFKESSAVYEDNDGTWFDVVTYNGTGANAAFLRREQFVVVGCDCTLEQADADGEGGFRPTLWNGFDYTEGEFVQKDFGVVSSPNQSDFCGTCCRDHHDGGSGVEDTTEVERIVYDPWSAPESPPTGDHEHYNYSGGDLEPAMDYGQNYVEACRLIRKDGFFRVTHDLNRQALFGFPQDYLDNDSEVTAYSGYVIEAATDYVASDLAEFKQPGDEGLFSSFLVPASSPNRDPVATAPTTLPTPLGNESQQLRSRGVYVDYVTNSLRSEMRNCPGESCIVPEYASPQEMLPFFELQLTELSTWTEAPIAAPVDVGSKGERSDYAPGEAALQSEGIGGQSEIEISLHVGNPAFLGGDPVVPADFNLEGDRWGYNQLYSDTSDEPPPPTSG
jgi:Tfp pilus assembly protein PilV